jgi:putative transposase
MEPILLTRAYKYLIQPTPMQLAELEKAGATSRFLWNRLTKTMKKALYQIQHGYRGSIEKEYKFLRGDKKLTGNLAGAINLVAQERGLSRQEAFKFWLNEKFDNLHKLSPYTLACEYAKEKVNNQRIDLLSPEILAVWTGLQVKWGLFSKALAKGKAGLPKFKKFPEISAIQKQIAKTQPSPLEKEFVNLKWCGSICLEKVKVVLHRPIPQGARITQLALKKEGSEWFVVFFIEGDRNLFVKDFPATGQQVGIDPGMKTALTYSDGKEIHPPALGKNEKVEKRLRKLQRKLMRQTLLNNPKAFKSNKQWVRGVKINRTKGMEETKAEIAKITKHFAMSRQDFYHVTAKNLLMKYDLVAVGNAKMYKLTRGVGKAKRAQNKKTREHAIESFKTILKDKASLSMNTKTVLSVNESLTSKTCSICGFIHKEMTLEVRDWLCPKCGTPHQRDVNAAKNILTKALIDLKNQSVAGAQPVKVRSRTGRRTQVRQRASATEIPISQEGNTKSVTVTNGQVSDQLSIGSRESQIVVVESLSNKTNDGNISEPQSNEDCSQCQPDASIT